MVDYTGLSDFEKELIIMNFLTDKIKQHEEDINQVKKDIAEVRESQKKANEEISDIKKMLERLLEEKESANSTVDIEDCLSDGITAYDF